MGENSCVYSKNSIKSLNMLTI